LPPVSVIVLLSEFVLVAMKSPTTRLPFVLLTVVMVSELVWLYVGVPPHLDGVVVLVSVCVAV
jgi:hypothetical protein